MNKLTKLLLAFILASGSFVLVAHGQVPAASEESITSFQSTITVNKDNTVDVVEAIVYNTGPIDRHGIYRDIYPYSAEGRPMSFNNVTITDENGTPYQWQRQTYGDDVRFKIGDPNVTFRGERRYIISYEATNAVTHPESVDEIYWNVTGNDWVIPILNASATVNLPNGVVFTRSACYYGPKDSTSRCDSTGSDDDTIVGSYNFMSPGILNAGEGLTVAVGFPKGVIPPYTDTENISAFIHRNTGLFIAAILPIMTFLFMFIRWRRLGRDPKGRGTIIPEYDVPDGLSPFEVSCIVNQRISNKDISAEIVYLATRGYIKIRQVEEKILGVFNKTDYEFELLKDYSDLSDAFDVKLMNGIFLSDFNPGAKTRLSYLKDSFYVNIPDISDAVVDAMLAKGYYSNLNKSSPFSRNWNGRDLTSYLYVVFLVFFVAMAFGLTGSTVDPVSFVVSIALTVAIFAIFSHLMPAKTEKGIATKDYILGLKLYLQIAEKDRLAFNDAPEKKPEIFERLLPYAMALGVDGAWAKEFEGICNAPPNWYEGYPSSSGMFSVIAFNNSLSIFGTTATSSMASSPSGSGGIGGSGGGGFSGGGGGGGGGGGW